MWEGQLYPRLWLLIQLHNLLCCIKDIIYWKKRPWFLTWRYRYGTGHEQLIWLNNWKHQLLILMDIVANSEVCHGQLLNVATTRCCIIINYIPLIYHYNNLHSLSAAEPGTFGVLPIVSFWEYNWSTLVRPRSAFPNTNSRFIWLRDYLAFKLRSWFRWEELTININSTYEALYKLQ